MKTSVEITLEAILFMAGQSVALNRLATAVELDPASTAKALAKLQSNLSSRGIRLAQSGDQYSLVTAPSVASEVENFIGNQQRTELSKAALETLAIIAYRQPVTKTDIDAVRGVSSEQTLKNLLLRGLITESGRAKVTGKPVLYSTSLKFLEILGLSHAGQLPKIEQDSGEQS